MVHIASLQTPIEEALKQLPESVHVLSMDFPEGTFQVARHSLEGMQRMGLGELPLSTVALPDEGSHGLVKRYSTPAEKDISKHLSDFFPNYFAAAMYELQSFFQANEVHAYIVGGIVRDMLLSGGERCFDVQDVDITIEGEAVSVVPALAQVSKNVHVSETFPEFGTVKVAYKDKLVMDFASTRWEVYEGCGHLPNVQSVSVSLQEDVSRRDFTVNALALSISKLGTIVDWSGGLADLEARQIQLLKAESFFEDPSRVYRALKFATRLDFQWSDETTYLLDQFLQWVPQVYKGGGERIKSELMEWLALPESEVKQRWLRLFSEKGLHRLIDTQLPEKLPLSLALEELSHRIGVVEQELSSPWENTVRWRVYVSFLLMSVSQAQRESAMVRLGLTRADMDVVEKSVALLQENRIGVLSEGDDVTVLYDMFHGLPESAAWVGVLLAPQYEDSVKAFVRYRQELADVALAISGDDIIQLGVPEGAQVGRYLKQLLHAKLHGHVQTREDELEWITQQLTQQSEEDVTE